MTPTEDFDHDGAEFQDAVSNGSRHPASIDWRRVLTPSVLRAVASLVVGFMVLFWPERTDRILVRLIGVGLIVFAGPALWSALRRPPRRWLVAASSVVASVAGVALVVSPLQSDQFLGRLLGVVLIVVVVLDLAPGLVGGGQRPSSWQIARGAALQSIAVLLIAFPEAILVAFTVTAAICWIAVSMLVIGVSVDAALDDDNDEIDPGALVSNWWDQRPKSVEDRTALAAKLSYDGPMLRNRVLRFLTLMTFASVIASMGVITDSTAVVIGAMLIAPLMTPLMGMALALVMGWPTRLGQNALVALAGVLLAIAIGVALGFLAPTTIDPSTNAQIISRASPTVLDLIIAVAAGAAGAYGLSRPDVSDALPGVAIAIALVPPLTVVGIAYSQGDWDSGTGALLLFTTNMLAILVVGGLTFIATGVAPIRRVADTQRRVRTSLAGVATLTAIAIGGLLVNGTEITQLALERSAIDRAVANWLDGDDYDVVNVDNSSDLVTVTILGPRLDPPSAEDLVVLLDDQLGRAVTVEVRLIPQQLTTATSE